jgi:hypothetical protein
MIQLDLPQHSSASGLSTIWRSRFVTAAVAVLALVAFAVIAVPRARAVTDEEELTRFGSEGAAAGQLNLPAGVATDPTTGHVYVVGQGRNKRIDEFTPWGTFVKAFGWNVAPGPVNEQQEIRVRAAAGQFKLGFGTGGPGIGETSSLPFDANATEIEAALNALTNISTGSGSVGVEAVPGTTDGVTPYVYVVTFKGSLAGTDVAQLTVTNGTVPLSGGHPATSLEVRTRADGTATGTGLESCTAESGCQKGLEGSGAGQSSDGLGVAVGSNGDVYVRESGNDRVQEFDSAGRFLLMFGGGVDQGPHHPGDVCTAANLVEGDTCGAGSEGGGQGEFARGSDIVLGAGGTVFVPDKERIEEFQPNGVFKGEVKVPGETVRKLAVNPKTGGFYAVFGAFPPKENVRVLGPTGALEGSCEVKSPGALAADSAGDLYVVSVTGLASVPVVLEFDPGCKKIAELAEAEPIVVETGRFALVGLGTNAVGDLYVTNGYDNVDSFIRSFGPGPVMFEAPPKVPPTIDSQFASSVQRDGATVAALINPHFWTDARYYVQYGTGRCSEGGCEEEKPIPPGGLLTSKAIDASIKSAGISLENLDPGTTYHYRFVAESSGGGPVKGEEVTFTTFPARLPSESCPNEVFRGGPAARLPNCRAYEMVSPVEKNSGDIKALIDITGYATTLGQSAEDGNKLTYSSYRGFAEPEGGPYTNQYIAARDPQTGWSTKAISVPQGPAGDVILNFENQYMAFSGDLCDGWLLDAAEPVLAPGAPEGFFDLYRRDNCGGEGYEALIAVEPHIQANFFTPELQGTSADGKRAVLRVKDKLTNDASSGVFQTYYSNEGQLHLICILPSGTPSAGNCSGGTGLDSVGVGESNRFASVSHAISADGSRVYWTASAGAGEAGFGKVYLRENPGQEQSALSGGECTEAEKACTLKVSETKSPEPSRFLGANPDGSKALFEVTEGPLAGNLYEFDLEAGASTLIGKKTLGLAGAGEDLSYIYFVSEEASSQAISEGAVKGRPNLYLANEGTTSFIAKLSATDANNLGQIPSDINPAPVYHAARVSADGHRLAFISTESLTGYDNTDAASPLSCGVKEGVNEGVCDSEVYVYEAGSDGPLCVSCNPSGAQPQGRVVQGVANSALELATAGSIPASNYQLAMTHALSADGGRLFFNSYDALLPRDTNGKEDLYQWEAAGSQEACVQKGAELYVASSGGCLSLISSGESSSDSEFLAASPDGHDAFFTTNQGLLPQDPGLYDVYDAREGGGIAQPVTPAACEGEACQGPFSPPNDPTPGSASFRGAGNVKEVPARKKTAHKKKHAKKHSKKKHVKKLANNNRRADR